MQSSRSQNYIQKATQKNQGSNSRDENFISRIFLERQAEVEANRDAVCN